MRIESNPFFLLEIDGSPSEYNAIAIDDTEFYNCRIDVPPELGYVVVDVQSFIWFLLFLSLSIDNPSIVPSKMVGVITSQIRQLILNGNERTPLHPHPTLDPVSVGLFIIESWFNIPFHHRSYNRIRLLHLHRSILPEVRLERPSLVNQTRTSLF